MKLNPYYTAGIVATIATIILLLSPAPRNYALVHSDSCTTRLSFDGSSRHEQNNGSNDKILCTLSSSEYQMIDAALVLAYACSCISLLALCLGLQGRKNKFLAFLVIVTALLQGVLLCVFVIIVLMLDGEPGPAVYLQALIFAVWIAASIWHVAPVELEIKGNLPQFRKKATQISF